jgi:cytoskeletal protein CcmA (bactofilin family)
MWKREEAPRPPQPVVPPTAPPPVIHQSTTPRVEPMQPAQQEKSIVNIGKSVIIKGELSGSEDLTIEGQVEGKIELRQNVLTIGPNAKIKAQVLARAVVVEGTVQGNISSSEKIEIRDKGSVEGDLSSPRVAIADGAHFRGSIDMQQAKGAEKHEAKSPAGVAAAAPAATPAAAPAQPGPVPAPVGVAR